MATVLITGSKESVPEVAAAVSKAGAEPLVVHSLEELNSALAGLEPGSLSHYIQLPVSVYVSGPTITGRVLTFLEEGIIGRYKSGEALLPYLKDDASIVLVAGNTALEASTPDDRQARMSLLHVLSHAMRADKPDNSLRVQVVHRSVGAEEIAAGALSGETIAETTASGPTIDPGLAYDDWRTEVLGMATTEI